MKALETLIRLRRDALDRRRQALAALEQRRADLSARQQALEQRIVDEQRVAASDASLLFAYDSFARRSIEDREALARAAAELDDEIEAASEDLRRAFTELKKFEIARDQRDLRERVESERREQRSDDEMALSRFRHEQREKTS